MECLAHASGCSHVERILAFLDQPQTGLVGVEQRPGPIDDVIQHGAQVQLPGQLLCDVAKRPGSSDLALGTSQRARSDHIRRDGGRHGAQEGDRNGCQWTARIILKHQGADDVAPDAERDLAADWPDDNVGQDGLRAMLGRVLGTQRGRRGDRKSSVRLQVQDSVAALPRQVGGDPRDSEVGSQGFDRCTADGSCIGRRARSGAQATQDRQLGVHATLGQQWRAFRGALGQQALNITRAIAPISSRIDAKGWETTGIGPGADRVWVDAEQRGGLGDADQRLPVFSSLAT